MSFPILTTERLTLRQLEIHDDRQIFLLRSDVELNKYLERPICNTLDEARDFISRIIESNALYWAVTLRDRNILIGTICLFGFTEGKNKCEIGYELLVEYQGQGIMKEAAEKVIDYAFNTIKVQKIEAYFHRDNQGSMKLLKGLSFINLYEPDKMDSEMVCYCLTNSQSGFARGSFG